MYKGSVDFVAEIKGDGLTFPLLEFNPNEPGVAKVEIKVEIPPGSLSRSSRLFRLITRRYRPGGDLIRSTVHLASVASTDEGMVLARKVNTAALNRIAFLHNIAIENARMTRADFSPLGDQPGVPVLVAGKGSLFITGNPTKLRVGLSPEHVKAELEQVTVPAERYYGFFRSTRQSRVPAEEFMHLYNILLMLFKDEQVVNRFIVGQEPAVAQTPSPCNLNVSETVYTRLRNDFAHPRTGDDLQCTKTKMRSHLGHLMALTKRAIELHAK
jgi:hypothetical protein